MILAPLRGVTIRTFREVFARPIIEAGFTEAFTPFIAAMRGMNPLKDRELKNVDSEPVKLTPQFIGKDSAALTDCLQRIREAGYETADLNCGCPFPMVRNKGRGSGILRTPETLERMLMAGCETMGEGKFSIKVRLGVERTDELLKLMPIINTFPLRYLAVHGRVARQMYEGQCDFEAIRKIIEVSKVPVVVNGDLDWRTASKEWPDCEIMVGRSFVRGLGERQDIAELLNTYIDRSVEELDGDRPVLGRLKELIAYWQNSPRWYRRWKVIKLCRSIEELKQSIF